jgi:hypothetical protein
MTQNSTHGLASEGARQILLETWPHLVLRYVADGVIGHTLTRPNSQWRCALYNIFSAVIIGMAALFSRPDRSIGGSIQWSP